MSQRNPLAQATLEVGAPDELNKELASPVILVVDQRDSGTALQSYARVRFEKIDGSFALVTEIHCGSTKVTRAERLSDLVKMAEPVPFASGKPHSRNG